MNALIGIVMGSDSDLPTMKAAAEVCEEFGIPYEMHIVSAHRTPIDMANYAQEAHKRGVRVYVLLVHSLPYLLAYDVQRRYAFRKVYQIPHILPQPLSSSVNLSHFPSQLQSRYSL